MERNTAPRLFDIALNFIVDQLPTVTKKFTKPLNLPADLVELVVHRRLKYLSTAEEIEYLLGWNAPYKALDFSSNIYGVSWFWFLPTDLRRLDAANCTLIDETDLDFLQRLSNLQVLNLRGCSTIPELHWGRLLRSPQLHVLDVSSSQFGDEALATLTISCPNLTSLNLRATRVFRAIGDLRKLTKLSDLDLLQTKTTPNTVTELCKSLKQLKTFKIDFHDDGQFAAVLKHIPISVESLTIRGCPSESEKSNFHHLTALQRLELTCWSATKTYSIRNFKNLTWIHFKNARIVGASAYDWSNMKYVNVRNWDTDKIPPSLIHCQNVKIKRKDLTPYTHLASLCIVWSHNIINVVPRFTNLKSLHIHNAVYSDLRHLVPLLRHIGIVQLTSHVPFPGLATLTTLEKLRLYHKDVVNIGFGKLTNLTSLAARGISLDQIACLTKLEVLSIRRSYDTRIELLTTLTNLTKLDLTRVEFSVPSFLSKVLHKQFRVLKWLSLDGLLLTPGIVNTLSHLKNLETLVVFTDPSKDILQQINANFKVLTEIYITEQIDSFDELTTLARSPSISGIYFLNGPLQPDKKLLQRLTKKGISFV